MADKLTSPTQAVRTTSAGSARAQLRAGASDLSDGAGPRIGQIRQIGRIGLIGRAGLETGLIGQCQGWCLVRWGPSDRSDLSDLSDLSDQQAPVRSRRWYRRRRRWVTWHFRDAESLLRQSGWCGSFGSAATTRPTARRRQLRSLFFFAMATSECDIKRTRRSSQLATRFVTRPTSSGHRC